MFSQKDYSKEFFDKLERLIYESYKTRAQSLRDIFKEIINKFLWDEIYSIKKNNINELKDIYQSHLSSIKDGKEKIIKLINEEINDSSKSLRYSKNSIKKAKENLLSKINQIITEINNKHKIFITSIMDILKISKDDFYIMENLQIDFNDFNNDDEINELVNKDKSYFGFLHNKEKKYKEELKKLEEIFYDKLQEKEHEFTNKFELFEVEYLIKIKNKLFCQVKIIKHCLRIEDNTFLEK